MHEIEIKVDKTCRKIIEDLGYEFVEVKCEKIEGDLTVTLVIYKDSGITFSDCKLVSNAVDETLEELNPTNDSPYFLDISSYGLDKPLKFDWQFKKYINKKVEVKLYRKIDNLKEFVAVLKAKNDEQVVFEINEENKTFNLSDVAYILPYIEF